MKGLLTVILYISPPIVVSLLFVMLILPQILLEIPPSVATAGQSTTTTQSSSLAPSNTTNTANAINTNAMEKKPTDMFGITEIYPTKQGGREWFLNMSYPKNSSNFSITDNFNLSKLSDGSWRINASHVRMVVGTSGDEDNWNNTEVTGYIRLSHMNVSQTELIRNTTDSDNSNTLSTPDDKEIDDLVFISRSGRHSSEVPCEGTAYNGVLHTDGSVGWKKEIWHTGGYTDERAKHRVAESFLNRWVGWKVVVYNIIIDNETRAVKLESYIGDDSNTNNWTKVADLIDSGGWYANTNNSEFFSAGCGRVKDYIIADEGPNVVFRTDNLLLDFKNLSIREIQPLQPQLPFNANLTSVLKLE